MASDLSLGEAARALGVSVDTVRRWDRAGKIKTTRDERNRRRVPRREISRLSANPQRHQTKDGFSARIASAVKPNFARIPGRRF